MRRTGSTRPAVVMALFGLVVTVGFAVFSVTPGRLAAPNVGSVAHDVLASLPLAFEPADASAPDRAAAPAQAASSGHDRRVRALGLLTLALLLAATVQTVSLRRRTRAPAPTAPVRNRTRAKPGLRVLDDADVTVASGSLGGAGGAAEPDVPVRSGGARAGSSNAGPSKGGRTPKARGGPKGAGPKRARPSGGKPIGVKPSGVKPSDVKPALSGDADLDDGGEATVASPSLPPKPPAVHEPAIAQLLEEDMWRPEPGPSRAAPPGPWERLADDRSDEVEAVQFEEQELPQAPEPAITAAYSDPPIPPVPAEDLSFWDLFPEDLPPARAGGPQVDDLGADLPALPPVDDLLAGTQSRSDHPDPLMLDKAWPDDQRPPPDRPAGDADSVVAELLDGAAPAGPPASAEPGWGPDEDALFSDLLFDDRADAPQTRTGDEQPRTDDEQTSAPLGAERSPEEGARIAADRARRRRSRRSGRRKRSSPGESG